MNDRIVRITPRDHRLAVRDRGVEIASFPIASARYGATPKYWSNDYRNASGRYEVAGIFRSGSPRLEESNAHHVPWYLSPMARDPYEDAGFGVYGEAMIVLNYPNAQDWERYTRACRTGLLRRVWERFCRNHLKPLYERISLTTGVPFAETIVETDYGSRTYTDVLEACPILDPKVAFGLGVAIHGTNDPACIGTPISAGCIRMHNQDIRELLTKVEVGTPVELHPMEFFSL